MTWRACLGRTGLLVALWLGGVGCSAHHGGGTAPASTRASAPDAGFAPDAAAAWAEDGGSDGNTDADADLDSSSPPLPVCPPPPEAGAPASTTCATTGDVKCGVSITSPFPIDASAVTAVEGTGAAPTPSGGAVTSGDYQLVSETIWGQMPPNEAIGGFTAGDVRTAILHVSCDQYYVLSPSNGDFCGRLVPGPISLAALAGFADAGSPAGTPYSATPTTLTLIFVEPYTDDGFVEASLTDAQEYVLVGSAPPVVAQSPPPAAALADASSPRDPRCPAMPPAVGDCCDPGSVPLGCEYGGDAYGRCTTLANCALQPDGNFRFVSVVTKGPTSKVPCQTNPPDCPSTYAAAMAQEVSSKSPSCPGNLPALTCDYPEAVCGCGNGLSRSAWACAERPAPGGPCPTDRPLAGDACAAEGQVCFYGNVCAFGVLAGPSAMCTNGYWELFTPGPACSLLGP